MQEPRLGRSLVVGAAVVILVAGVEHFAGFMVLAAFSALIAVLSRRMQLALLRRGGSTAKPYYWAPFELFTLTP